MLNEEAIDQEKYDGYIGYIRYFGEPIKHGLFDMRKAATALLGFDDILKYFLIKEDSDFSKIDLEIPIKVREGSWEVLIPEIIDKCISIKGGSTAAISVYAYNVLQQSAKDGFFESGPAKDIKKVFKASLVAAKWVIKIATHVKGFKKKIDGAIPIPETQEVNLPDEKGKYLLVPKKYFDLFVECREDLFAKNSSIVDSEIVFELGVVEDGKGSVVQISSQNRGFFCKEETGEEEIILPELEDGQYVELEGEILRLTENMNTIGFSYRGHTLTCKPKDGNLVSYKEKIVSKRFDHVFATVRMKGVVDRSSSNQEFKKRRPMIFFVDIELINDQDNHNSLF